MNTPKLNPIDPRTELERRADEEAEMARMELSAPVAAQEPAAKKLIGWRTDDYLQETSDPEKARNWSSAVGVLPIFAGDPNTKLEGWSAAQAQPDHVEQPLNMVSQAQPEARAVDEVVSGLYRKFKEWSKRGFGPDDVTWCEVRADVVALMSAQTQKPVSDSDELLESCAYHPTEFDVRKACDLITRVRDAYGHWGGWSATPDTCQEALNLLRYSGTNAAQPKLSGYVGELPAMPIYTDSCTAEEFHQRVVTWGHRCFDAGRIAQAQSQPSWNAGELDERATFDAINLRDHFNSPLSYREREIAFAAWKARAALAKGTSTTPTTTLLFKGVEYHIPSPVYEYFMKIDQEVVTLRKLLFYL